MKEILKIMSFKVIREDPPSFPPWWVTWSSFIWLQATVTEEERRRRESCQDKAISRMFVLTVNSLLAHSLKRIKYVLFMGMNMRQRPLEAPRITNSMTWKVLHKPTDSQDLVIARMEYFIKSCWNTLFLSYMLTLTTKRRLSTISHFGIILAVNNWNQDTDGARY